MSSFKDGYAQIVFMGHFVSVLEEIVSKIFVDFVVVEDKKSALDVVRFCEKNMLRYVVVKTFDDIKVAFDNISHIGLLVVASFGIILREDLIKKCGHVVNIHPGDIPNCRGRHPLPCAILNKHKFMAITAHLIDSEKIDCGPIIAKIVIPINYRESYRHNEKRLLSNLRHITSIFLDEYVSGGKITSCSLKNSENGIYYNPLTSDVLNKVFSDGILGSLE
ncbi:MAG: hypothetical protein LBC04_04985 [Holosporaceae bacterium]|nr:hypothetical protein [Holosporaceae bacterium]